MNGVQWIVVWDTSALMRDQWVGYQVLTNAHMVAAMLLAAPHMLTHACHVSDYIMTASSVLPYAQFVAQSRTATS